MSKYITFDPIVYRVYDVVTKSNGIIPNEVMARHFFPRSTIKSAERALRDIYEIIQNSSYFHKAVICTPEGVCVPTDEEFDTYIRRIEKHGKSELKKVSSLKKKRALHGQYQLQDTPYKREYITAIIEPETPHMRGREAI